MLHVVAVQQCRESTESRMTHAMAAIGVRFLAVGNRHVSSALTRLFAHLQSVSTFRCCIDAGSLDV